MIQASLKKEILLLIRDGRLVFSVAFLLLMLIALVISSASEFYDREHEKQTVGENVRDQWDNQGVKHPHRGAHFGIYVFRENTVLSVFEPGILPFTGQSLWLEPHKRNMTRFNAATDAGPVQRLVNITPAFILYGLFPLLLLSVALNQIPQEREQGTLRMLHSAGFSPYILLLSKLTAQWFLIGVVLLPAIIVAIGIQIIDSDWATFFRILLLTASYGLFYMIIGALGLAIGVFAYTVRMGQLIAIFTWTILIVLAPRLAGASAFMFITLPTPAEFWASIEHEYVEGVSGEPSLSKRMASFDESLLNKYGVDTINDVPIGVNAARRLFRDSYADGVYEKHFNRLWQLYYQQEKVLHIAAVLTPVLAIRSISIALSGSSLEDQKHFEIVSEKYRREVNTNIDKWDLKHTHGNVSYEQQYSDEQLWQRINKFNYTPKNLAFSVSNAWPGVLGLLSWLVFTLLLMRFTARRLVP